MRNQGIYSRRFSVVSRRRGPRDFVVARFRPDVPRSRSCAVVEITKLDPTTGGPAGPGFRSARSKHFRIFSTRFIRNCAGTALAQSHQQDESNLRVVRERGPAERSR